MKKTLAASVALVLGLGGAVGLGISSASAHDHTDNITCASATVDLANYDGAATVKVTLDGNVVHDTAPFGGQYHYSQALSYDADHTSHTLKVEVISQDPGYSFTHTDVTPAGCYTPPPVHKDVPIVPVVVHKATCQSPVTYDVPAQDADVKYAIDPSTGIRPTVGKGFVLASGTLTIEAHVIASTLVANGGNNNPNDYSITITGGAAKHDASCVPEVTCKVTGPAYHELDDHASVITAEGRDFRSFHDGHATGYLIPVTGNLQGINSINYTTKNIVGNGIFFRFVVDLTADGGSSYNSLSVTSNHVNQNSVADVGSKNVFLGKTIHEIADLYPDAKYTAIGWQTGSSYAAGDGATLTGYSGDCGEANTVPSVPETTHRTTDTHTDVVCTQGGVGGGSYTETVTKYTTAPVWNNDTHQYDLVETVDSGYPVVTVHTVDPSRELCPIEATPVAPTVKAVCDTTDKVTLAETAGIVYSVSDESKKGETVTATAADKTVLTDVKGWTLSDDKTSATFKVVYDNSNCPITVVVHKDGTLAFTGSDPSRLFMVAGGGILIALILIVAGKLYKRREEQMDSEEIL